MREYLVQIAPHAILLPIGIRQDLICHIQNPLGVKVEAVLHMAGPRAANATQRLFSRLFVLPAMIVITPAEAIKGGE